jgi:hypothetical protein
MCSIRLREFTAFDTGLGLVPKASPQCFPSLVNTNLLASLMNPSSLRADTFSGQSEERKGLLSGINTPSVSEADTSGSSPPCHQRTCLSFSLIGVLLGLILSASYCLYTPPPLANLNNLHFDGQTLRSNGTQEFKRTVLLVSIDGLRHALQSKHFTRHY